MIRKILGGLSLSMLAAVIFCSTASLTNAETSLNTASLTNAESSLTSDEWKTISKNPDRYVRESKSSISHQKLMESFEETKTDKLVFPEYYGGSYIDDNGDYVVCVVNESTKQKENALKRVKEDINSSDFKNKNVTYSYNELEEMMDLLNEYKIKNPDSKISKNSPGHSLSNRDNTIYVELIDMSEEQIALYKKEVTDSPIITFKKSSGNIRDCADLYPGRQINNLTSGQSGSMGYRARMNGKIGFVTAGHIGSVGDQIVGSSSNIGKIAARQNFGSVDAAFVEITSSHIPTNILNGTDVTLSTTIYYPAEGNTVHKRGAKTGHTSGVIYSTNASCTAADNTFFTKLVSTSLAMDHGDSGGIVYYNVTSGSTTTRCTVGIVKGNTLTEAFYVKANLINSALGLTRY